MKRYVKADSSNVIDLTNLRVLSIVFVDNAQEYDPRADYLYDIYSSKQVLYTPNSSREELLALDPKIRENIHDVKILRNLEKSDLTIQQQRDVMQANKVEELRLPKSTMQPFIDSLQDCLNIFVTPTEKNLNFRTQIKELGGRIRDEDILEIIQSLTYSNYRYSKYSYADKNWNALLSIFRYRGSHTFPPIPKGGQPVTVDSLDLYVKLDLNEKTNEGYVAVSFHNWNDR